MNRRNSIGFGLVFFVVAMLGTAILVYGNEKNETAEKTKKEAEVKKATEPVKKKSEIQVCKDIGDLGAELERKRTDLELRERNIVDMEDKLAMQEKIIVEKLRKLEVLKKQITGMLEGYNEKLKKQQGKMVTVVETMTPKAAAEMIEKMDEFIAIQLLEKMSTKRMAKIMNNMRKDKSARLSERMAGKNALPAFDIEKKGNTGEGTK